MDLIHLICLSPTALRQVLTGEFLFPVCCSFVHLAKLIEYVNTKTEHQIFTHDLKHGSDTSLKKQFKVFELYHEGNALMHFSHSPSQNRIPLFNLCPTAHISNTPVEFLFIVLPMRDMLSILKNTIQRVIDNFYLSIF